MSTLRTLGLGVGVGLLVGGGGLVVWSLATAPHPDAWWRGELDHCPPGLHLDDVDASLALGRDFLLMHQKPRGDFTYEYDWAAGIDSPDNNQVRQAGATWGTALMHHDDPDPELREAMLRAIAFWDGRSRTDELGRRWTVFPGADRGLTGTTALVALAHVEALRTAETLDPALVPRLREHLDGYLRFIRSLRMPQGGFADTFDPATGRPVRRTANPYADGEALLLLVKAAKYLEGDGLWEEVEAFAERDHERWVAGPLSREPDPDLTKGYYQWGSMSWWELADAGRHPTRYGSWLVDLAVWMIDDHRTLQRRKNTAYAYEGIVSAWAWATRTDDPRADKLECVIDQGMPKLMSWQIGHPDALPFVARGASDPRAVGGIQNAADEAPLRIDVVQHQMHATLLARRFGVAEADED